MSNGFDQPATAPGSTESFDAVVLPHLDAGYRLARWLMRDEHEAEDVVQEASLRAFRYFRTFCGGDGRAWFLRIVRNTCYGWRRRGFGPPIESFDEEQHSGARPQADPETLLLQADDAASIARAMSSLPDHFHQVLILREVEHLSYRELAEVIGVPVGTVMSRLSRAREALRGAVADELKRPGTSSPAPQTHTSSKQARLARERLCHTEPITSSTRSSDSRWSADHIGNSQSDPFAFFTAPHAQSALDPLARCGDGPTCSPKTGRERERDIDEEVCEVFG